MEAQHPSSSAQVLWHLQWILEESGLAEEVSKKLTEVKDQARKRHFVFMELSFGYRLTCFSNAWCSGRTDNMKNAELNPQQPPDAAQATALA